MTKSADRKLALRALPLLDLTDLSDTCLPAAIDALCARALTPHGHVAAICIWPQFITQGAKRLSKSPVRIATVINFPKGGENIYRAVDDTREALRDGAQEIDFVMPWGAFLRGDAKTVQEMIAAVRGEIDGAGLLKVILETGALADESRIAAASRLAIAAGADFIKTSTGKIAVSATPAAAKIMLDEIRASKRPVGFKAAGGVRTLEDVKIYLDLADTIMGKGWVTPATFRFGASGLLDVLLAAIDGAPAPKSGSY